MKRRNDVLAAMPGTLDQVSGRIGLARSATWRLIHALADEQQCHIGSWERTEGRSAAVWVIGPGQHAVKPVSERMKREARTKALAREQDLQLGRKLIASVPRKRVVVPVQRDPLTAAFFGEVQ